ncbi:ER lumen protein retaining receptor-domain-containing protein [Mycena galopus ATCC 62051]|nr:ER lumen protein retaining receptor-domain-containing protein [Mycena galopus ATCC 62051]
MALLVTTFFFQTTSTFEFRKPALVVKHHLATPELNDWRELITVSFKIRALYAGVFVACYLDPRFHWVLLYNLIMKLFFIASSCYILYIMYYRFWPTHDPFIDTFRIEYLLRPCVILGLVFNYHFNLTEILWSFSIFLDGASHTVEVYTDISAEWVSGNDTAIANWTTTNTNGCIMHQVSLVSPTVYGEFNNHTEYGSAYNFHVVNNDWPVFAMAINLETVGTTVALSVFALGHAPNTRLGSPLWIQGFLGDYSASVMTTNLLDVQVKTTAMAISADYYGIVVLSLRQAVSGTEITISKTPASVYHALYIPNWIYWCVSMVATCYNVVDPIVVTAGIMQTGWYIDFFYVYFIKYMPPPHRLSFSPASLNPESSKGKSSSSLHKRQSIQ